MTDAGVISFGSPTEHLLRKSAPVMHLVGPSVPNPGGSVPTQHLVPSTPAPLPPKK